MAAVAPFDHQLGQQPVQYLGGGRHPGAERQVHHARPLGDGHSDVAHQHPVPVARPFRRTGETPVGYSAPLHRAATSAAVGKDTCAPSLVTVTAPTRAA